MELHLKEAGNVLEEKYIAALDCRMGNDFTSRIGIFVKRLKGDQYARICPDELTTIDATFGNPRTVYIRKNILLLKQDDTDRQFAYWIRHIPEPLYGYFLSAVYPDNGWNADGKIFRPPSRDTGKVGAFQFQNKTGDGFVVIIGRDAFDERWCTVIPYPRKQFCGKFSTHARAGRAGIGMHAEAQLL